ncbi:hypothetical protein SO3561_10526 [Streptomyces olivochromogenes]|uniref:Uncharacterized protein n=1 Tax=Streptomyces olivochromogenes TaxID=1963 RepID=A0A286PHC2_STROL|nr:hypothetical protein SO3561_10526 [Streptomyces olivochromogenes]
MALSPSSGGLVPLPAVRQAARARSSPLTRTPAGRPAYRAPPCGRCRAPGRPRSWDRPCLITVFSSAGLSHAALVRAGTRLGGEGLRHAARRHPRTRRRRAGRLAPASRGLRLPACIRTARPGRCSAAPPSRGRRGSSDWPRREGVSGRTGGRGEVAGPALGLAVRRWPWTGSLRRHPDRDRNATLTGTGTGSWRPARTGADRSNGTKRRRATGRQGQAVRDRRWCGRRGRGADGGRIQNRGGSRPGSREDWSAR